MPRGSLIARDTAHEGDMAAAGFLAGKRGLVMGVANNRSIAWGIAKACHAAGAEIALTWQGDALKKRVEPLAKELDGIVLGEENGAGSTSSCMRLRSPTAMSCPAVTSIPARVTSPARC